MTELPPDQQPTPDLPPLTPEEIELLLEERSKYGVPKITTDDLIQRLNDAGFRTKGGAAITPETYAVLVQKMGPAFASVWGDGYALGRDDESTGVETRENPHGEPLQ